VLPPNCDVAGHTKREEAKRLIQHISSLTPDFEETFMHALSTTETYGYGTICVSRRRTAQTLMNEQNAPLSGVRFLMRDLVLNL
jgi:hypothetical protein